MSCVLDDASAQSYTPVSITCTVPPGVGTGWEASLRGLWVGLGPSVGYAAPNVTALVPSGLPIRGGQLTLVGSNFGASACALSGPSYVELVVSQAPAPDAGLAFNASTGVWGPPGALQPPTTVRCNVSEWWDTRVTCAAPPGLDANVSVRLVAGGQVSEARGMLSYDAPTVLATTMGPMSTSGGALILINGNGFPPREAWPIAVTVGGASCVVNPATRTDTRLECVAPPGWGRQRVVVRTPLQASAQTVLVQYDGPDIVTVGTPEGRPVEGGFPVDVAGRVRTR